MDHADTFACGIESLLYKQDLSQDFIKSLIDKIKAAPTIVLWGAGQGGNCCGRPIISWDAFLQLDLVDYLIVVSCGEGDEIKSQCMKDGIPNDKILIPDLTLFNTAETDYRFIWNHISEFNILYQLLNDDWSRKTLTQFYKIKTHCYHAAVWSQADTLRFRAVGSGSGYIDSSGDIKISAISLDSILKDKKVDFIKMDIEGAEMHALAGAFEVISKSKPILAISVYHDPSHLFQIPMLIKSLDANYKLYLRHYRECSVSETVCYAIPGGIGS